MIVAILKVTRYLTGSQCSFWSAVVMCDLRSSPRANLLKIPSSSRSLQVSDSVVDCSEVVRDLGIFFDSEMSMKHHVSKTRAHVFTTFVDYAIFITLSAEKS